MSTKDEPKCESVTEAQSVDNSVSFKCTIKPSGEFLHVYKLSYMFNTNKSTLNNKEIKTIKTNMDKLYNKVINSENATLNDIITLAYSYQNLCHGYIKSNQKKELYIGNICILRCLNLVRGKELSPKSILIALKGYYQLGFIYFKQNNTEKAVQTCNKAIELYLTYTRENEKYASPIDFEGSITKSPLDGCYLLNITYKNILKLLIETNTNIDDHNMMVYNHLFLAAELNTLEETEKYLQWIEEALKMCRNLLKYDRFAEARNCIVTATNVREVYFHKISHNMRQQLSLEKLKLNEYIRLNIIFIVTWQSYVIKLLRKSVERLLRLEKDEEFGVNNLTRKPKHLTKSKEYISQRLLLFNKIDTDIPLQDVDRLVPVKYIFHYEDAYKLFISNFWNISLVKSCLDSKKNLKTYLGIMLYSSKMYKYVALYEKDVTRRNLLQNEHVNILSEVVENKNFLTCPDMLSCIRLYLAIAYSTMIEVKLENLDATHSLYMPQRHNAIILEIEYLVRNGLTNLKMSKLRYLYRL